MPEMTNEQLQSNLKMVLEELEEISELNAKSFQLMARKKDIAETIYAWMGQQYVNQYAIQAEEVGRFGSPDSIIKSSYQPYFFEREGTYKRDMAVKGILIALFTTSVLAAFSSLAHPPIQWVRFLEPVAVAIAYLMYIDFIDLGTNAKKGTLTQLIRLGVIVGVLVSIGHFFGVLTAIAAGMPFGFVFFLISIGAAAAGVYYEVNSYNRDVRQYNDNIDRDYAKRLAQLKVDNEAERRRVEERNQQIRQDNSQVDRRNEEARLAFEAEKQSALHQLRDQFIEYVRAVNQCIEDMGRRMEYLYAGTKDWYPPSYYTVDAASYFYDRARNYRRADMDDLLQKYEDAIRHEESMDTIRETGGRIADAVDRNTGAVKEQTRVAQKSLLALYRIEGLLDEQNVKLDRQYAATQRMAETIDASLGEINENLRYANMMHQAQLATAMAQTVQLKNIRSGIDQSNAHLSGMQSQMGAMGEKLSSIDNNVETCTKVFEPLGRKWRSMW